MRALYYCFDAQALPTQIIVEEEKYHHLKVIRVRSGEEILLLNGKGDMVVTKVEKIDKKSISLTVQNIMFAKKQTPDLTVFLAAPKKDAFEDCVRFCVELGVTQLVPVMSQFSQFDPAHLKRANKIIESSLEQSNNPYYLEISPPITFEEAMKKIAQFDSSFAFSSIPQAGVDQLEKMSVEAGPIAICIGPEAGFSKEEEEMLGASCRSLLNLPLPIMRTPTALCVAVGHVLGMMK